MEALTTVLLKPGEGDRIVAGHPWIYHGEILRLTAPVVDGALVQVKDHRQRLLGVGADIVIPDYRDAAPLLDRIFQSGRP